VSESGRVRWSLYGAIAASYSGSGIDAEYARRELRKHVGPDLPGWNDHPRRTKRQVLDLLDTAIFDLQHPQVRRGAWRAVWVEGVVP
jgi:hypothetical protein